jgi:hypothetical protein
MDELCRIIWHLGSAMFAGDSFKFEKRSQLFISTHNETLSVIAMRVGNKDSLPIGIHG